jgi:hypothetical protein
VLLVFHRYSKMQKRLRNMKKSEESRHDTDKIGSARGIPDYPKREVNIVGFKSK